MAISSLAYPELWHASKAVSIEPIRITRRASPRIGIKVRGKILFVNCSDVVSVQAEGNYVALQCDTASHLLRESISQMEQRLAPHGFIRIHRSVLVNESCVEELRPLATGEYLVRMRNGKEFTATRTYKQNLKSIAEFWIGTGAFFHD